MIAEEDQEDTFENLKDISATNSLESCCSKNIHDEQRIKSVDTAGNERVINLANVNVQPTTIRARMVEQQQDLATIVSSAAEDDLESVT